jgi:DNA-binding CsgD family transcriptional regulator
MRERLNSDYHWTPRQRQVLDLLRDGRTNAEVAEVLGISIQGVKWHITEILGKLQADSREEAAEYWRRYNGLPSRFARMFRGVVGLSSLKWAGAAAAGTVVCVAGVAIALVAASGGDNGQPPVVDEQSPAATARLVPAAADVTYVELGFGGPMRMQYPLPLEPDRPAEAATIARLLGWLAAGEEVASTAESPEPSAQMNIHTKDSFVAVSDAWSCTRTENSVSCWPIADEVILTREGGDPVHLRAPELTAWLRGGWQTDFRVGSIEERNAAVLRLASP